MYHIEPQDYYCILKNQTYDVYIVETIDNFWRNNKDFWFSHSEVEQHEMVKTNLCLFYNKSNIGSFYNKSITYFKLLLNYDQLNRHPIKNITADELDFHERCKPHMYRFATHIALNLIQEMHHKDWFYKKAEPWQQVFILLAIRHNNNLKMKYLALAKVHQLIFEYDNMEQGVLYRFLKATILDINRFKLLHQNFNVSLDSTSSDKILNIDDPIKIYDYLGEKFANILEVPSSKQDIPHFGKQKMKEMILTFQETIQKYINANLEEFNKNRKIAISISGGVDSMVASYITCQLAKKYNFNVIFLHICYNNRDCVDDELEFLKHWAKILNVNLYVRHIDEIKRHRNTQYRAVYEEVTRNIRFAFYEHFNCPVILGHNKDDVLENIFSNLSKKIHFDNLYGMKPISKEGNITLLRPMLNFSKKEILGFSQNNILKIHYLEDSTPCWSNRGKMRDILIPGIKQFNPDILTGILEYVKHTNNMCVSWKSAFNQFIENSTIKNENNSILVIMNDFFERNYENLDFWVQLWFSHDIDTRPSNKSFNNIIFNIKKYFNKETKKQVINMNINKHYNLRLKDNTLHIYKTNTHV